MIYSKNSYNSNIQKESFSFLFMASVDKYMIKNEFVSSIDSHMPFIGIFVFMHDSVKADFEKK